MMKLVATCLVLVACQRSNEVRVLLGPAEDRLSIGFRCVDSTGTPLLMRAMATGHFAIVIDGTTVEGGNPGCRSEDLVEACVGTNRCRRINGYYCVDVEVADVGIDIADLDGSLLRLGEYIRQKNPTIIEDAPDSLVMVRAITSTATCAELSTLSAAEIGPTLMGCAYSCPSQLDTVQGSLSLSLDALTTDCESTVRACALFPNIPRL